MATSFVGELGILLIGGQYQRIGIAVALNKQARVLVSDEFTCAFGKEAEQADMESIGPLS
ncbi:hypothetical protein [Synechococcus sp. UW105]|uniref:hypothetical protein n=1 Tax=Synechococcus sp. UW105 TaxID=337067 RepID=UPI000E0EFB11|nr:hypothetical protein [Synechococcus sp. UW105]